MQRVPGQDGTVTEGRGNRPKAHGSVEFLTSSSTDQANVPSLAPPGDVSPTSSRPGRIIAVTASQDRDETPRTHQGLPKRPAQQSSGRPPAYSPSADFSRNRFATAPVAAATLSRSAASSLCLGT